MKPKLQGAGCAEQTLAFQGKLGDDKEGKKHRLLAHVTNPRYRKVQEQHGASRARKQERAERLSGPVSKDTHRRWLRGLPLATSVST